MKLTIFTLLMFHFLHNQQNIAANNVQQPAVQMPPQDDRPRANYVRIKNLSNFFLLNSDFNVEERSSI